MAAFKPAKHDSSVETLFVLLNNIIFKSHITLICQNTGERVTAGPLKKMGASQLKTTQVEFCQGECRATETFSLQHHLQMYRCTLNSRDQCHRVSTLEHCQNLRTWLRGACPGPCISHIYG